MAKYYKPEEPTPVFAVTFVSNRKGIVEEEKKESIISNNDQLPEDIKTNYKYSNDQEKTKEEEIIQSINNFKKQIRPLLKNDDEAFDKDSLNSLRKKLTDYRATLKGYFDGSNSPETKEILDAEYLIYSNVEIQSTGVDDLSKQSNWYLRDAEVEITRDWPICKAKLIVTCKLNDDGSIPSLVEVENGFVYDQNNKKGDTTGLQKEFIQTNKGRFLSADDEVRIYAGYKNETCVSMNDLDEYPFDFTNLEITGDISTDSSNGKQLKQLEAEKKAIEDAISNIKNSFSDPLAWYYSILGVALLVAGGVYLYGLAAPAAAVVTPVVPVVPAATTATTTVIAPAVAPAPASTALQQASIAGTRISGPVLKTVYNQAYNAAIKAGLGATAAGSAALLAQQSVNAETTNPSPKQASEPFKAKLRDYLDGRRTFNDNKELISLLEGELISINNLIQIIQRKTGIKTKKYCADPNKIAPIFWGFIDSVDFIGNSTAGIQIIYNLRDRSRILADTKLITIPFTNASKDERGVFEGLRHKTIEGVYRASNGGVYLDNSYKSATSATWRDSFEAGEIITLWDNKLDPNDKPDPNKPKAPKRRVSDQVETIDKLSAIANDRIKFTAAIEDPARWTIANSFLPSPNNKYDPLFHIWTLQPPLVSGSGGTTMQIVNKSPFEILSYLQMTEVMPIDVFSSHINGHFMFAPRVLDTTGLNDPERGNRLYFFFQCFDETPAYRSLIKDIRVTTSSIGVYNRFTVSSADINNPTNASLTDIVSIFDVSSANTKNKKVPIKQHIIVDPKIKDASKQVAGGTTLQAAQALALTTASTMARDHTTVILKVIGDSSFYPGEAIRVYNTVLHSNDTFTFNAEQSSSAVFLKALYNEVENIKKQAAPQGGDKNKIVNLNDAVNRIRDVAGKISNESVDLNQIIPMYKIRAITHSLKAGGNDAGFTTKIIAIADIL